MSPRERHERMPSALRGAAALWEMLNMIGEPDKTNENMVQVFCENEIEVRSLLAFAHAMLDRTPS